MPFKLMYRTADIYLCERVQRYQRFSAIHKSKKHNFCYRKCQILKEYIKPKIIKCTLILCAYTHFIKPYRSPVHSDLGKVL